MQKLRTQMRWIMAMIAVAFLLSSFLMYDRGSSRRGNASSGQMEDYVVAEVNGKSLMRSALDQQLRVSLQEIGLNDLTSVDLPYLYQAVLNQYAMEIQMEQEVRNSGISVSDAEAEQALKEVADQMFPTREAFYQWLERSGKSAADYKKELVRQMSGRQLVLNAIGNIAVSEDEAVQFYDSMKNLFFTQAPGFNIHLANFPSQDKAEMIRARLIAGDPWDKVTSGDDIVSTDMLNATTEPMFVPESVFEGRFLSMKDLKIDEVSPVFEVMSNDFAVGFKTERIDEKTTPYEEVSADIRSLLLQQKQSQAVEAFSQSLLEKAKIVVYDKSLFPEEAPVLPVTLPDENADKEKEEEKEGESQEAAAP